MIKNKNVQQNTLKCLAIFLVSAVIVFLNVAAAQTEKPQQSTDQITSQIPSIAKENFNASSVTYSRLNAMARSKNRKEAILLAQKLLKENDNSDIRILLGLMLSWEGRYDEARKEFQHVLSTRPDNIVACQGLANVELWSGHNEEALKVIENGLKYDAKNEILLQQKQKALQKPNPNTNTNTVSISKQKSNSISFDKINFLAHHNQIAQAKQLAEKSLQTSDNVDIRLLLGLMNYWDGHYDQARLHLEKVLDKKPGYTDASIGLADVEITTGHNAKALDIVNRALKYHSRDQALIKKRDQIIQAINSTNNYPVNTGLLSASGSSTPSTTAKERNAIAVDQQMSYVDDLKQTWNISSISYERHTDRGPIIFTYSHTRRFDTPGSQLLIEAYPHLLKGTYAYLAYGHSKTSYLAQNYYSVEPYFSLPQAFEFSLGERILQFQRSTTYLTTGSLSKYIGSYWISFRPYWTSTSGSYFLTTGHSFSNPQNYISLTVSTGTGSSTIDFLNPDNISPNRSKSIRANGHYAIRDNIILFGNMGRSYNHFPNDSVRNETYGDLGVKYLF